jgi:acetaldehyde dehydrogenase (acetylating)
MPNWTVNPQCVGQSAAKIARMAGFEVPADTSIICAELEGVGKQYPLSAEKLSPVLSLYFVKDYNAALDTCFALLKFGGMGHTAVIHSKNDQRTREYAMRMPAMRVLVNTAAPYGSIGITTNVFPAMTLGCGAMAGNITSDNVGPQNLINIKRLAYTARQPQEAFEMPIDYNTAGPSGHPAKADGPATGPLERSAVAAAVERYLASRGVPVAAPSAPLAQAPQPVSFVVSNTVDRYLAARKAPAGHAPQPASAVVSNVVARFLASRGIPAAAATPAVSSSVVPNVSAQVVDRFLATRGVARSKTEFG